MTKKAEPKKGPSFPATTEDYDDDLMPHEREKLETPRATLAGPPGPVVFASKTWECPTHKVIVVQGDPCPKCGKKLLLD